MFETKAAFDRFKAGQFRMAADASAVVLTSGVATDGDLRRRGGSGGTTHEWGDGGSRHWGAAVHLSGQVRPSATARAAHCMRITVTARSPYRYVCMDTRALLRWPRRLSARRAWEKMHRTLCVHTRLEKGTEDTRMGTIRWIVSGLIVGVAKFLMPGGIRAGGSL